MFTKYTEYVMPLRKLAGLEGELVAIINGNAGISFTVRKTPLNANVQNTEESDK